MEISWKIAGFSWFFEGNITGLLQKIVPKLFSISKNYS